MTAITHQMSTTTTMDHEYVLNCTCGVQFIGDKDGIIRNLVQHQNETARYLTCGLAIGDTRACPDCGRPQHYTGTELGWCHDALVDTWECNNPRKAGA